MQIKSWEEEELDKAIDMEQIRVDPSPFQLVERTSLHKVSSGIVFLIVVAPVTVMGYEHNVANVTYFYFLISKKKYTCSGKKNAVNAPVL